jgi:plasmid replication initiation protein
MKNTKTPLKSKTPKVYKNKKLNNANLGDLTLNDYQIFLQLISKIGGVNEVGKYLQPHELFREYTLTAKEFASAFNIDLAGAYKVLQKASKKLARTAISLEKPELFEVWEIPIGLVKYNYKEGNLTIKFSEEIMPYLAQVKQKFVLYNLKEVSNFGSLYTTRLYELIQEYKDTGVLIKSVEQLRELFNTGNKYKAYKDFKVKTFQHAVEEINSQYELDLKFIEHKTGRKVEVIEFLFNKTFIKKTSVNGKQVNIYIKPKRKIKSLDNEAHPNQQDLFYKDLN